jgi:hypothetical protein
MSTTFSTIITGTGVFAVPTDDASLAAASAGFTGLLAGVPNLTFDAALAFVRDGDGGASRTLNCLITNVKYSGAICPSAVNTQTLLSGIKAALLASPSISAVSVQEANLVDQSGGASSSPWTRDAGGFIYPAVATDDLYIGGVAPNGVWLDSGEMALGASGMSGNGERLRVIGDVRVESNVILPTLSSGVFVGAPTDSGLFSEQIRAYSDTQAGIAVGVLSDLVDTNALSGPFAGFKARFVSATGSSGTFVGFEVDPSGGDFGWSQIGFRYPDMLGTALQGSEGFVQVGPNETNRFNGRCAIGGSVGSSSSLKVSTPSLGSGATWVNLDVDRGPVTLTGGFNWDLVRVACNLPNAVGQSAGRVDFLSIKTPVSAQAVTVNDCAGVDIEPIGIAANYTFTNPTYGIYQRGSGDLNYFAGNIGIGTTPSTTALLKTEDDLSTTAGTTGLWTYQNAAVTGTKSSWTGLLVQGGHSSTGTITTSFGVDVGHTLGAGSAGAIGDAYGFRSSMTLSNASDVITNGYGFYVVGKAGAGTLTNAYGLYLEAQGGGTLSYGVYQAAAADDNYFAGKVGIGSGKSVPSEDLEVAANIRCDGAFMSGASAGLSGTYTFGGGGSGDIASMTFSGGILTAVTLVP